QPQDLAAARSGQGLEHGAHRIILADTKMFTSPPRSFAALRMTAAARCAPQSIPVLEVGRPVLGDRVAQAAAEVDLPVLLGHAPGMEMLAGLLHRPAVVLHTPPAPL